MKDGFEDMWRGECDSVRLKTIVSYSRSEMFAFNLHFA